MGVLQFIKGLRDFTSFLSVDNTQLLPYLQQNPALVNNLSINALYHMGHKAANRHDFESSHDYQIKRAWLRRCQEMGIEQAFVNPIIDTQSISHRYTPLLLRMRETTEPTNLMKLLAAIEEIFDTPDFVLSPHYSAISDLGMGFLRLYTLKSDPSFLAQAETLILYALYLSETQPLQDPGIIILSNLALIYKEKYFLGNGLQDLELAIEYTQQSLEVDEDELFQEIRANADPNQRTMDILRNLEIEKTKRRVNLANLLLYRHSHKHDADDLAQAINYLKQADRIAWLFPKSERINIYSNLGNALLRRALCLGHHVDLNDAVVAQNKAVNFLTENSSELSIDSVQQAIVMNNLGESYLFRFLILEQEEDLHQAIEIFKGVTDLIGENTLDGALYLLNLGRAQKHYYEATGDVFTLDEIIKNLSIALHLMPQKAPFYPFILTGLGEAYLLRYSHQNQNNDTYDLKVALGMLSDAVKMSNSPISAYQYGKALLMQSNIRWYDRWIAKRNLKSACQAGIYQTVLDSASVWGDWAMQRKAWKEAIEAYTYGIEAAETVYKNQITRYHKESSLRANQGLFAHAAYAVSCTGELEKAALLLEQGRARLLSDALNQQKFDLMPLQENHPELYKRYMQVTETLHTLETITDQIEGPTLAMKELKLGELAERIQTSRAMLNEILQEIRQIEGYKDFLQAPELDLIQLAAVNTPIVYLAVTNIGALALIVNKQGSLSLLQFNELTKATLHNHLLGHDNAYLHVYEAWRNQPKDGKLKQKWMDTLDNTTKWLWDIFMGQLVAYLLENQINQAVLIPQDLLGLLPLHAAWCEDPLKPGNRYYASSDILLTYAPNAQSLVTAAQRFPRPLHNIDTVCVIDNPDGSLVYSDGVVFEKTSNFAEQSNIIVLQSDHASYTNVIGTIQKADVMHFSTHGFANLSTPLQSKLLLSNNQSLTLENILSIGSKKLNLRLVILSACETMMIGTAIPDEVVSLPTGFLQAGSGGVIGSLWAVDDASTQKLMDHFYNLWQEEQKENKKRSPAQALWDAQKWLRESARSTFYSQTRATQSDYFDEISNLIADDFPYQHPYFWAAFAYTGI